MKNLLRKIYYSILKLLPARVVIDLENKRAYGRKLGKNKKDIVYFGEKIQYLKLYGNLEKYNDYADKYVVRDYIKKRIGEEYLIPLLGVYDKPDEINYDALPDKFVLKVNHGSGYNIICKDKETFNIKKANKKLRKWLKEDFFNIKKEYQYKNILRKIVCEKYISDKNGDLLDYKFFCFDGIPKFVQVDYDRFIEHKVNFYDMNWNKLDFGKGDYKKYEGVTEVPENFDEMVKIARTLSKEFNFVRVDLYDVDGKIYFGELTFTPAGGQNPFHPLEKDREIAKMISI